jgi:hypothetical protein
VGLGFQPTAQAVSRAHVRVPVISLGRYVTRPRARYDFDMSGELDLR